MTFANITDVGVRLGRPIADANEIAQVNAWLGDVEGLILARIPNLLTLVAAGFPAATTVLSVEANAVIRKIKNPDGKVSEGVDDYNYRLNENARKGEIFLTDDEWALLTPASVSAAFSTRPGFEPDWVSGYPLNWWELNL
ncbi:Gp19/Gp15/Gp42 family protein [Cellulomonas cellasea]|uniref:Gp19/Gp15/Gp42 family protein n=1 Tax=Cellulomonas cellasea TaxID=43670 RepID=UPI0025A46E2F|nr:Gp19/Gp15/Gp42 family protein [Cellulomonas cellasea]MDM8084742.1 Gp19/Gp15/Gp42 family protein [Cellulomonas cellasea]